MLRVMDQQLSHEQEPWNVSSKHTVDQFSRDKELPALPDESVSRNVTMRTTVRVAKTAASKIVQKLGHFRRRSQVIPCCGFKCCHVSITSRSLLPHILQGYILDSYDCSVANVCDRHADLISGIVPISLLEEL